MFKKRNSFKSSKKPAPRRSSSLSTLNSLDETVYSQSDMQIDYDGEIKLTLGAHELVFKGGQWFGENEGTGRNPTGRVGSISSQAYVKLQKQNEQLQEENNFLKFKLETLLDLAAIRVAEHMAREKKEAQVAAMRQEKSQSEPANEYDVIN